MEIKNQKLTLLFENTESLELESPDLNYVEITNIQEQRIDRQEKEVGFVFVVDAAALNKPVNNQFSEGLTIKERLIRYQDITSIKIDDVTYGVPYITNLNDDNILQRHFYTQKSGDLIVFANILEDQISNVLSILKEEPAWMIMPDRIPVGREFGSDETLAIEDKLIQPDKLEELLEIDEELRKAVIHLLYKDKGKAMNELRKMIELINEQ